MMILSAGIINITNVITHLLISIGSFLYIFFYTSVRPGTQPDGLVVQVILGFSGGLHGLVCADFHASLRKHANR